VKLLRVLVVGTGTEIGKTHVTTCLLSYARAQGRRVRAYKSIATGVERLCEDAERHAEAVASPYMRPAFAYRRPVSPHVAAREEARPVDLDAIRERVDESTGSNARELARTGVGPIAVVFPRAKFDGAMSQTVAASVWIALGGAT